MNPFDTSDWKGSLLWYHFQARTFRKTLFYMPCFLSSLCSFLSSLGRKECYRRSCDAESMGHQISPLIASEAQRRKSRTSSSWRMDETYIKVKGQWVHYYRAIDKFGKNLHFSLRYFGWNWGGAYDSSEAIWALGKNCLPAIRSPCWIIVSKGKWALSL